MGDSEWRAKLEALRRLADDATGKAKSFASGVGEGVSFGFGDEIAGALGGLASYLPGEEGSMADRMRGRPLADRYRAVRDMTRATSAQAKQENPRTFLGGELVGAAAPAVATLGTASAPAAAGLGARLLAGAGRGALQGAAFGLGSSDADLTRGDVGGAALDTGIGAVLGGGLGAAGTGAGAAAKAGLKAYALRGLEKAIGKFSPYEEDAFRAAAGPEAELATREALVLAAKMAQRFAGEEPPSPSLFADPVKRAKAIAAWARWDQARGLPQTQARYLEPGALEAEHRELAENAARYSKLLRSIEEGAKERPPPLPQRARGPVLDPNKTNR